VTLSVGVCDAAKWGLAQILLGRAAELAFEVINAGQRRAAELRGGVPEQAGSRRFTGNSHRVHVVENVVAVELSIRGTFSRPCESLAGVIKPTGAKLDVPGADFRYVEGGKEFNCYVSVSLLLQQMGIQPNFAAAVGAQAAVELNHTIGPRPGP